MIKWSGSSTHREPDRAVRHHGHGAHREEAAATTAVRPGLWAPPAWECTTHDLQDVCSCDMTRVSSCRMLIYSYWRSVLVLRTCLFMPAVRHESPRAAVHCISCWFEGSAYLFRDYVPERKCSRRQPDAWLAHEWATLGKSKKKLDLGNA